MLPVSIILLAIGIIVFSSYIFVSKQFWLDFLTLLREAWDYSIRKNFISSAPKATSFNFLQLPPELRLMVYERLEDVSPRRVDFTRTKGASVSTLSLIATPPPPSAILATCRLMNQEASGIIRPMVRRYIDAGLSAPYIEADAEALNVLRARDGLFHKILFYCRLHAKRGAADPRLGELVADLSSLHKCITQYGYEPTVNTTKAAQMLDMFTKMAARAILEKGTVYGQSFPRHDLPTSQGRRIDIMLCEQNHHVEFEISHQLPQEVTVKRLWGKDDSMKETLPWLRASWLIGISKSIDAAQLFLRNSPVPNVVVVIGEIPRYCRRSDFWHMN